MLIVRATPLGTSCTTTLTSGTSPSLRMMCTFSAGSNTVPPAWTTCFVQVGSSGSQACEDLLGLAQRFACGAAMHRAALGDPMGEQGASVLEGIFRASVLLQCPLEGPLCALVIASLPYLLRVPLTASTGGLQTASQRRGDV